MHKSNGIGEARLPPRCLPRKPEKKAVNQWEFQFKEITRLCSYFFRIHICFSRLIPQTAEFGGFFLCNLAQLPSRWVCSIRDERRSSSNGNQRIVRKKISPWCASIRTLHHITGPTEGLIQFSQPRFHPAAHQEPLTIKIYIFRARFSLFSAHRQNYAADIRVCIEYIPQ